ncbi:MAG: asparagine synthase (glutamine-hydrolyzing) [Candidatus Uhrbacteria bacterium]|nr:asparagine synthase (glutamine-hydrolyzing) [Candidatus Uhrbacteria bacterium]
MCGIAGIVTKNGAPPGEGDVRCMTDALAHRGPDGGGVWIDAGIGLGHRRLAIIDLTDRASQPMRSGDGRWHVTYNGEIYNYIELRDICEKKGSTFRSTSDTEVVLEMFRHFGSECVKQFRGMFAFAIWDRDERKLFFARDRIGKKPFFYRTLTDGSFAFASEMCALRALEPVTIDEGAIRLFFGLQYVPSPYTGFTEISGLPAGSCGWVDHGSLRIASYHDWSEVSTIPRGDVVQDIRALLDESVRIRLRSDVTVGAFLSGGIDSTAMVAIAQQHLDRGMRTFTMGFPSIYMDERAEARKTAAYFGTDHQEFEARPEDLIQLAESMIALYGGPYADSSALPVMLLAREVAREVKVVLVGDGGDELFGGYRRYQAFQTAKNLSHIPGSASVLPLLLRATGAVRHDPRFARMAETVRATCSDANRAYGELFCGSYFGTKDANRVLQPDFLERQVNADPIAYICAKMGKEGHPLARAMRFDLESYLADDLNPKMDRATMAYGLEARAPLLDQQLVAYALRLPVEDRLRYGQGKVALKRALKGLVPDEVLHRPKRGFQVPLAEWFRTRLDSYWKDRCLDPSSPLHAYVKPEEAARLFDENMRGTDHGNRLWMLLSLAVWLEGLKK